MDCSHEPEPGKADPFGDAFQNEVEMLAIDIRARMIAVAARQLEGRAIHPYEVIDLADVYVNYAVTGHVPSDAELADEGEAGEPA